MLIIALIIAIILFFVFLAVVRTLIGLALLVLVALVAGLIAEAVVGKRRRNPVTTIIIGFIGAFVGAILARLLGLPHLITIEGLSLIWTIIGASVVVFVWHLIRPERA